MAFTDDEIAELLEVVRSGRPVEGGSYRSSFTLRWQAGAYQIEDVYEGDSHGTRTVTEDDVRTLISRYEDTFLPLLRGAKRARVEADIATILEKLRGGARVVVKSWGRGDRAYVWRDGSYVLEDTEDGGLQSEQPLTDDAMRDAIVKKLWMFRSLL